MHSTFDIVLSYLLLYKYATIFVVVASSAFIVPLPTSALLLAAGAFASQGYLSFATCVAVAAIANTIGDTMGYTLTRIFGYTFIEKHYKKKHAYFVRVERY